jgi:ribonuclease HII
MAERKETLKKLPNFRFEKKLWRKHYKIIAGVDEVGRGCFAGPVVAAAVAFAPMTNLQFTIYNEKGQKIIIDDSKRLTTRQRERAEKWIKENALSWGIGEVSATLINRSGMAKATKAAFRKAIKAANLKLKMKNFKLDFLLADAFFVSYVPGLPTKRRKNKKGRFYKKARGRQMAIIDGDQKSISIAAASIIAKVYRDKLMLRLSKKLRFKKYGWGRNKGYGTKEHQKAIKKYGITRYHRKQFVETFLKNSKLPKLQKSNLNF